MVSTRRTSRNLVPFANKANLLVPFTNKRNLASSNSLNRYVSQHKIIQEMRDEMIMALKLNQLNQKKQYEQQLTQQDILISLFQIGLSSVPLVLAKVTGIRYNATINSYQQSILALDYKFHQDSWSFYNSMNKTMQKTSLQLVKSFLEFAKITNVTVFEILGILFILVTVLIVILQLAMRRKRISLTGIENKR